MIFRIGKASPLGATLTEKGINFSLFSPYSTKVELLLFKDEIDKNPQVIELDSNIHKTYYYWHIFIEGLKEGCLYAYRVYGNSDKKNRFDASKVLLDPYGKAIVGSYDREESMIVGLNTVNNCLKNYVIGDSSFNWEGIQPPQFSNSKSIIYEMHPKGFTKNLPLKNAGTFSALIEKIPYLKKLGINTVELMPIFFFDSQDAPKGKTNYWGYSPISFFALHHEYCFEKDPLKAIDEFKNCVKEFHRNNIKVVLDVVYNHTSEADFSGPWYSFKGIANSSYYMINERGDYLDFTGCGNTINANHSVVRRMILDSLNYWKKEFHIDGFRFDLAGVFTRDENGNRADIPPIIWEIDSEPQLANCSLIAEPWDVKGYNGNFPGDKWSIWQDNFRDVIREAVRGDYGKIEPFLKKFTSSFYQEKNEHLYYKPQRNINYITCHDGFTLNDLVSYNHKHNLANGEDNRDGTNHNLSFNYGVEGPTDIVSIEKVRERQMKNFFSCLILAHGTPMLCMGDEVKRTQYGNNNPYSLDIPENWFDWNLVENNKSMFEFVKKLINIRHNFKIFTYKDFFKTESNQEKPYFFAHGVSLHQPDFSYYSRSIALEYISPKYNERLFLIFNFYIEDLAFQLPEGDWETLCSTMDKYHSKNRNVIKTEARSVTILQFINKYKNWDFSQFSPID